MVVLNVAGLTLIFMSKTKVLTITDFARMGGIARARSMSKEERVEAARRAGQGNKGKSRKPKQKENHQ